MDFEKYPRQYWHCYMLKKKSHGDKYGHDSYINDTTIDRIVQEIVLPWQEGRPFAVSGLLAQNTSEIDRLQITHTRETSRHYAEMLRAQTRGSGIAMPVDSRRLPFEQSYGTDYTHEFLIAPRPREKELRNINTTTPSLIRSYLRRMLTATLKTPSMLDAFCLDHFPAVHSQFSTGMDTIARMNLLLQENLDLVYEKLKADYPAQVGEYENKL